MRENGQQQFKFERAHAFLNLKYIEILYSVLFAAKKARSSYSQSVLHKIKTIFQMSFHDEMLHVLGGDLPVQLLWEFSKSLVVEEISRTKEWRIIEWTLALEYMSVEIFKDGCYICPVTGEEWVEDDDGWEYTTSRVAFKRAKAIDVLFARFHADKYFAMDEDCKRSVECAITRNKVNVEQITENASLVRPLVLLQQL